MLQFTTLCHLPNKISGVTVSANTNFMVLSVLTTRPIYITITFTTKLDLEPCRHIYFKKWWNPFKQFSAHSVVIGQSLAGNLFSSSMKQYCWSHHSFVLAVNYFSRNYCRWSFVIRFSSWSHFLEVDSIHSSCHSFGLRTWGLMYYGIRWYIYIHTEPSGDDRVITNKLLNKSLIL